MSITTLLPSEQKKDPQLGPIIRHLQDPVQYEAKPEWEKTVPRYYLNGVDDLLLMVQEGRADRIVVPSSLQVPLMELFHKLPVMGAHAKQRVTNMHLQRYFTWKGLTQMVKSYCKNCEECIAGVNKHGKVPGLMTLPRWPEGPFVRMHADTMRSLPTSEGYKHVLVVVDTYSRYIFTQPLRSGYPRHIVDALTAIFTRFGQPAVLVMDNGGEFRNREVVLFLQLWGVKWKFSSPYNPQANGQAEAAVKIIASRLRLTLLGLKESGTTRSGKDNASKWTTILPYVTMSYNCSPNEATGFSPYELIFGRMPNLPSRRATDIEEHEITGQDYSDYLRRLQQSMRYAHTLVDRTVADKRKQMKELFDKRRAPLKIEPGDFVYLTFPFSEKLKKFSPRATGPFKVEGVSHHPETGDVVAVTVNLPQPGGGDSILKVFPRRRIRKLTARLPAVDWTDLAKQAGRVDQGQAPLLVTELSNEGMDLSAPPDEDQPDTPMTRATEQEFLLFGRDEDDDTSMLSEGS